MTDQFIYLGDQDLVFCNLFAYDRLAYGHMLLMEYVWLMNHGSIANRIIYGSESTEIEPYVVLIFFYLICIDIYQLGEYVSVWLASCPSQLMSWTELSRADFYAR
jgi:hypothetical protein